MAWLGTEYTVDLPRAMPNVADQADPGTHTAPMTQLRGVTNIETFFWSKYLRVFAGGSTLL